MLGMVITTIHALSGMVMQRTLHGFPSTSPVWGVAADGGESHLRYFKA